MTGLSEGLDAFRLALELAGTAAFSISGAIAGIHKGMDLLGVLLLGLITASGGGVLRDLVTGCHPPAVFLDPLCPLTALAAALAVFLLCYWGKTVHQKGFLNAILLLADSLGLGIFTVNGVAAAAKISDELSLLLFAGVLTGVGGGVLRDILTESKPYIFVKHFYACASIAGALTYLLGVRFLREIPAVCLGVFITVLLRLLASHYRWNLPRITLPEE